MNPESLHPGEEESFEETEARLMRQFSEGSGTPYEEVETFVAKLKELESKNYSPEQGEI